MLISENSRLFTYAVTRDLGFAPNPFYGFCTLATCKPRLRRSAKVGDWVMGVGGSEMGELRRKCIYLMEVSEILSFDEYWNDERFRLKKPVRNGSRVQALGDNIYHHDEKGEWVQSDSHHSLPDGSLHEGNLNTDTATTDKVLVSEKFIYFGAKARDVDLNSIGHHQRIRDYTVTFLPASMHGVKIVEDIWGCNESIRNSIEEYPCHFGDSFKMVDQKSGKYL